MCMISRRAMHENTPTTQHVTPIMRDSIGVIRYLNPIDTLTANLEVQPHSWLSLASPVIFHDSAAAIIRDGTIVAAAQEERFTRQHDPGLPTNAIAYCLEAAGV